MFKNAFEARCSVNERNDRRAGKFTSKNYHDDLRSELVYFFFFINSESLRRHCSTMIVHKMESVVVNNLSNFKKKKNPSLLTGVRLFKSHTGSS